MPPRLPLRVYGRLLAGLSLAVAGGLSPALQAAGSSVAGTVVSRQGERIVPIFRATIVARQAGGSEIIAVTKTDQQGRFLMIDLPSPRLQLSATKNGFYTRTINGRENEQVVLDCTQPEDCAAVAFELGPAAAIMGMVVDEMGEPLSEVEILAGQGDAAPSQQQSWGRGGRQTDDRGYFRIAGLKPGVYKVKALGNLGRRGPPRPFESEAVEVAVDEGAEVQGVRLRVGIIEPMKTFTISGTVTGIPAVEDDAYQSIQLRSLEGGPNFRRGYGMNERVGNDGSFKLAKVAPGRYAAYYHSWSQSRRISDEIRLRPLGVIDVTADLTGLVLNPLPTTGFAGVVKFETRTIPEDLRLYISTDGEFTGVTRVEKPDFQVRVDNLTQGKHDIRVIEQRRGPARFFIKGVRRGSEMVSPRNLEFSQGTVESVEIIVSDEMASVSGRVKMPAAPGAGQPVGKAAQYQVGLSGPDEQIRIVQADQFGRFHLNDIVPGDYKICAWENLDSQAIHDEKSWEKAGAAVRKFSVEAGNDIEIELTAVP